MTLEEYMDDVCSELLVRIKTDRDPVAARNLAVAVGILTDKRIALTNFKEYYGGTTAKES
jgi:hypothetical protein